jgi:hypothetical protein
MDYIKFTMYSPSTDVDARNGKKVSYGDTTSALSINFSQLRNTLPEGAVSTTALNIPSALKLVHLGLCRYCWMAPMGASVKAPVGTVVKPHTEFLDNYWGRLLVGGWGQLTGVGGWEAKRVSCRDLRVQTSCWSRFGAVGLVQEPAG